MSFFPKFLILLALAMALPCLAPDPEPTRLNDVSVFTRTYVAYFKAKKQRAPLKDRSIFLQDLWRYARWLESRQMDDLPLEWKDKMIQILSGQSVAYEESEELDILKAMLRVVFLFPFSEREEKFLGEFIVYHSENEEVMDMVFERLKSLVQVAPLKEQIEKLLVLFAYEIHFSALKVEPLLTLPHLKARVEDLIDDPTLCPGHLGRESDKINR